MRLDKWSRVNNRFKETYMKKISRRAAVSGIIGTGAAVLSLSGKAAASPQRDSAQMAFRGTHQVKPLPFDAAKLKKISL